MVIKNKVKVTSFPATASLQCDPLLLREPCTSTTSGTSAAWNHSVTIGHVQALIRCHSDIFQFCPDRSSPSPSSFFLSTFFPLLFLHLIAVSSTAELPPAEPLRVMWRHVAEVADDVLKRFIVPCTDQVSRWIITVQLDSTQNSSTRLIHHIYFGEKQKTTHQLLQRPPLNLSSLHSFSPSEVCRGTIFQKEKLHFILVFSYTLGEKLHWNKKAAILDSGGPVALVSDSKAVALNVQCVTTVPLTLHCWCCSKR